MNRRLDYSKESRAASATIACGYAGCAQQAITRENDDVPLCRGHWEMRYSAKVGVWLLHEGVVTAVMSEQERRRSMAAYRKRISHEPKPDGLAWARKIKQRLDDGENVPIYSQRLAEAALASVLPTEPNDG